MPRRTVFILWIALLGTALAEPKIAMVRISDVYRSLDSTKTLTEESEVERKEVYEDVRLKAYQAVLVELQELQKQMAALGESDRSTREKFEQNFAVKRREALTLQREYDAFRKKRMKEINGKMVSRMEEILADIHRVAEEVGRSKGYDWVLDSSGKTNTGMPFVLYAKNPDDITSDVIAGLSKPVAAVEGDDDH